MKPKFTPGPWTVSVDPVDGWTLVMSEGKYGLIVANINSESFSAGLVSANSNNRDMAKIKKALVQMPVKANAVFIATAPEMYEALERCQMYFLAQAEYVDGSRKEHNEMILKLVDEVLKKARGEK